MNRLSEFRKITGYSNAELEKLTGYTRQGLHLAFSKITEGKSPQAKFKVILEHVIDTKLYDETAKYQARIAELKQLKEKLGEAQEGGEILYLGK
jgi:hypothetical protein